jgi:hypothetical protein
MENWHKQWQDVNDAFSQQQGDPIHVCTANTKFGMPCKNRVRPEKFWRDKFCHVHRYLENNTKTLDSEIFKHLILDVHCLITYWAPDEKTFGSLMLTSKSFSALTKQELEQVRRRFTRTVTREVSFNFKNIKPKQYIQKTEFLGKLKHGKEQVFCERDLCSEITREMGLVTSRKYYTPDKFCVYNGNRRHCVIIAYEWPEDVGALVPFALQMTKGDTDTRWTGSADTWKISLDCVDLSDDFNPEEQLGLTFDKVIEPDPKKEPRWRWAPWSKK